MEQNILGAIFSSLISLAIIVAFFIANWKIFTKAGIEGWKSLIPFYNAYILITKIARKPVAYFLAPFLGMLGIFFLALVVAVISFATRDNPILFGLIGLAYLVYIIFLIVIFVKINVAIAKNFGHSGAFAVGLILLPYIFYLILGFDNSKFIYKDDINMDDDEYEYVEVEEDD